jgi:L-rhamnose-H+ transport protein
MSILFGILYHFIGGGAAASFYLPFKKVKGWAWESYWLVSGIAAWIFMPLLMGFLFIPNLFDVIAAAPGKSLFWTFFFGLLWGIGGLTFGLSMRYLGISLGYAIVLGFTAAFGTVIPPVVDGTFVNLFTSGSGIAVLTGILLSLLGITFCGLAGRQKERELSKEQKQTSITEFNLKKGTLIALASGILSACMAFALAAGKPIAEQAIAHGAPVLWQNNAVLVVVLWGGFLTNFVWCLVLNYRNKTFADYQKALAGKLSANYLFSSLAGAIWYLQFFFYGMGSTQMGRYDFASWTLHMTFIITLSTLWGLYLKEWQGTSRKARGWLWAGLGMLLLSIVVIGIGGSGS